MAPRDRLRAMRGLWPVAAQRPDRPRRSERTDGGRFQRLCRPSPSTTRPRREEMLGGGAGTRTPCLRFWRPPLYLVSYTPNSGWSGWRDSNPPVAARKATRSPLDHPLETSAAIYKPASRSRCRRSRRSLLAARPLSACRPPWRLRAAMANRLRGLSAAMRWTMGCFMITLLDD